MTETRGRGARWFAAALAAPIAAGLFTGATAWAQGNDPLHSSATAGSATAAPAPTVAAAPDPTLVALQKALVTNARTVDKLSKQIAAVRAQATTLASTRAHAAAAAQAATVAAATSTRSAPTTASSGSSGSGGGTSSARTLPPIVVTIPAPAPPPTQAKTGASGAKK
jgi:hypothetical protein